jgi:CRISPR/Cas system-associated exonuclease Cas4 (RecB family)
VRPWSYSRKSTYDECPKEYWYQYVENVPGFKPASPAADRGSDLHLKGEHYLKGELKIYPPEYQKVAGHLMMLKAKDAIPEMKMAVSDKWEPVDWAAPEAYFRGIIDVHYEAEDGKVVHIEDFKTGKAYDSHPKQMETYVALVAPHYPKAQTFHTRLIYIDQGIITPPKITNVERLRPIRLMLDGAIKNAEEDTIFPVRAGSHCKWCSYSQRYGGPCPN